MVTSSSPIRRECRKQYITRTERRVDGNTESDICCDRNHPGQSWCEEYKLTFDNQAVLHRWTLHQYAPFEDC